MQETVADREQRWTTIKASAVGWLLPATAARRSAHVKLRWAFVSHFVAALLTVLLVCVMVSWAEAGRSGSVLVQLEHLVGEVVREADRHPKAIFAILAGSVVGIELGYVISALVLMSWGAADEPIRSSFAHALRRLWLHTWHAVIALLLLSPMFVAFEDAQTQWRQRNQPRGLTYPDYPQPPADATPGTQAWQDYQAELHDYHQEVGRMWQAYRRRQPWYVRYDEVVIGYACFVAATWILWSLLRAIGADRGTPPIVRPPTCETCGYNLTATPVESRCPECGEPAVASLGPNVRPGTLWQRRHETGRLRAWWRCCVDVIARPRWFGRQLKTTSAGADHRFFLAGHLVLIFFIGAAGIIMCYITDTGRNPFAREAEMVWAVGPCVGYFTSAFMLFAALLAAGLVGIGYGIAQKRNLMGAAMQVGSYLAGYLTLWALFAAVTAVAAFALEEWGVFRDLQKILLIWHEILAFFFWLLPNLACLALYFMLVWRATAGARYANR